MFVADITIYKPASATIRLVNGQFVVVKLPAQTIQALNKPPPVDLSAEIAALTAQVAALTEQNTQLTTDLAACLAGNPPPLPLPTITNMTATPPDLPFGGGAVVIDAVVTDAATLTLDGVPVTLPATVQVP